MKKYVFKPYSKIFPELFEKEKNRILSQLNCKSIVEHVGSTAVEGLGGKGIIDISIAVDKEDMTSALEQLLDLGYEYQSSFSTPDRLFFVQLLEDPLEEIRTYHMHLTYPESTDWKELIRFRDYLKGNPEALSEYQEIKKQAVGEANHEGERYRKLKEPFFKKVQSLNRKQ